MPPRATAADAVAEAGQVFRTGLATNLSNPKIVLYLAAMIAPLLPPHPPLWLAERGYDPAYGARPLRRLVQQAIGDQLARQLLAGDVEADTAEIRRRMQAGVEGLWKDYEAEFGPMPKGAFWVPALLSRCAASQRPPWE